MKNIFIFVADALRYDYLDSSLKKQGDVVRTLAPATWTPPSFSSILTGLEPINHNVDSFDDVLSPKYNTVFDFFPNTTFYDYIGGALRNNVLNPHVEERKELTEIEEPFVFVERSMETHAPYNKMGHGGEFNVKNDEPTSGRTYINKLREAGKWPALYEEAARQNARHFFRHVRELKKRGIYEDTLIVYTSDHGEFINEKSFGIPRIDHGHPMHSVLLDVPTVFLNHSINKELMRSIDIIPTALSITHGEKIGDGVDIRKDWGKTTSYCQGEGVDKRFYQWKATKKGPKCLEPAKLNLGKLIEDYKALQKILERKLLEKKEGRTESDRKNIVSDIEV